MNLTFLLRICLFWKIKRVHFGYQVSGKQLCEWIFTVLRFNKFLACIESITGSVMSQFLELLVWFPSPSLQVNEPAVSCIQKFRKSMCKIRRIQKPTCPKQNPFFPGRSQLKLCSTKKNSTPLTINILNPKNEGLVQMIFLCKMSDFQVPAVNFPGWYLNHLTLQTNPPDSRQNKDGHPQAKVGGA